MTTFFALVLLFTASVSLVPYDMKPNPILYRGRSGDAPVPNIPIMGPARPDTTETERTHDAPADSTGVEG